MSKVFLSSLLTGCIVAFSDKMRRRSKKGGENKLAHTRQHTSYNLCAHIPTHSIVRLGVGGLGGMLHEHDDKIPTSPFPNQTPEVGTVHGGRISQAPGSKENEWRKNSKSHPTIGTLEGERGRDWTKRNGGGPKHNGNLFESFMIKVKPGDVPRQYGNVRSVRILEKSARL